MWGGSCYSQAEGVRSSGEIPLSSSSTVVEDGGISTNEDKFGVCCAARNPDQTSGYTVSSEERVSRIVFPVPPQSSCNRAALKECRKNHKVRRIFAYCTNVHSTFTSCAVEVKSLHKGAFFFLAPP